MKPLLCSVAALLVFLAGVGAENVVTKVAAWCYLTGQRRRDRRAERKRVARVMSATALLDPPGSQLSKAIAAELAGSPARAGVARAGAEARPFVIELPRFVTHEMVCAVLRRVMCELRAADRRRYFPGDHTGGVN